MKRAISIGAALGLAAMAATSPLATAAPAPKVVIEDPVGDANGINDQGTGDGTFGDNVTPADISSVTDITAVAITNDAKNVTITFETEAGPPATQGVGYRLRLNPEGPGGTHCLIVEVFYPGAGNALEQAEGQLRDVCGGDDPVAVEVLANFVTIPRSAHKAFGKGATLKGPQAQGFVYLGSSYPAGVAGPTLDTTKVGSDYKLR